MEEKQLLANINLPRVFLNTLLGFGSGLLGVMVLGLILLITWSIVGEVLLPTNQQATNEFGEILNHKQETHPLFLSVVILAVFMATLVANILRTILVNAIEERYKASATSLTQVSAGNIVILLLMIPVYLMISDNYGAAGVASAALVHCIVTALFSFLALEIIALKRYLFISLYGVLVGLSFFLMSLNLFNPENPTIMAFVALPLLLAFMALGTGITQLVYFWFTDAYGNDFLDSDKRFGSDYGEKSQSVTERVDDFSQEFGEI